MTLIMFLESSVTKEEDREAIKAFRAYKTSLWMKGIAAENAQKTAKECDEQSFKTFKLKAKLKDEFAAKIEQNDQIEFLQNYIQETRLENQLLDSLNDHGIEEKLTKLSQAVENGQNYLIIEGCQHQGKESLIKMKQLLMNIQQDLDQIPSSAEKLQNAAKEVQRISLMVNELKVKTEEMEMMEEQKLNFQLKIKSMELSLNDLNNNVKNLLNLHSNK